MKIICIGRNYVKHIEELGNKKEDKPVFFLVSDSSLLRNNTPFYYPNFSNNIHYETEVVIKINRLGKNIDTKFAHRYYDEIGLGIDFTARDLQNECKEKSLPWTIAKSFDGASPISNFIKLSEIEDINNLDFSLKLNNEIVQQGNTKNMIFSIDEIISYLSKFMTLKIGDLIYTGTPEGVGPIKIGDKLVGAIGDKELLNFDIK